MSSLFASLDRRRFSTHNSRHEDSLKGNGDLQFHQCRWWLGLLHTELKGKKIQKAETVGKTSKTWEMIEK